MAGRQAEPVGIRAYLQIRTQVGFLQDNVSRLNPIRRRGPNRGILQKSGANPIKRMAAGGSPLVRRPGRLGAMGRREPNAWRDRQR